MITWRDERRWLAGECRTSLAGCNYVTHTHTRARPGHVTGNSNEQDGRARREWSIEKAPERKLSSEIEEKDGWGWRWGWNWGRCPNPAGPLPHRMSVVDVRDVLSRRVMAPPASDDWIKAVVSTHRRGRAVDRERPRNRVSPKSPTI